MNLFLCYIDMAENKAEVFNEILEKSISKDEFLKYVERFKNIDSDEGMMIYKMSLNTFINHLLESNKDNEMINIKIRNSYEDFPEDLIFNPIYFGTKENIYCISEMIYNLFLASIYFNEFDLFEKSFKNNKIVEDLKLYEEGRIFIAYQEESFLKNLSEGEE